MATRCKKVKYKDKAEAVKALHIILNQDDGRKKPCRSYECDVCGHWHLTSKSILEDKSINYRLKLDWTLLLRRQNHGNT